MTTSTGPAAPPAVRDAGAGNEPRWREPAATELAAPSERGRLIIPESVVATLATHIINRTPQAGGVASRMFGIGSRAGGRDAAVSATVHGAVAVLDVRLSIAYPSPVADTCERVRARLIDQISELTGLRLREVNITVDALTSEPGPRRDLS